MQILDTDKGYFADIDGTLVDEGPQEGSEFSIVDPLTNTERFYTRRERNIELIRNHFYRGYTIVAWSAGGAAHAAAVVRKLGIEDMIKYAMTKPIKVSDDLEPNKFLSTNVFLKEWDE